jgi:hypothetical protein
MTILGILGENMQDNQFQSQELKEQLARIVLTPNAISRHCKRLKKEMKGVGQELSLMQSQDMFARIIGMKNYHELGVLMDKIATEKEIIPEIIQENMIEELDNFAIFNEFQIPPLQKCFAMSNTQMRLLDEMHQDNGGIYLCIGLDYESISALMASLLVDRLEKDNVRALIVNAHDEFDYQQYNGEETENPVTGVPRVYRPKDNCPHDYYDRDEYRQEEHFKKLSERALNYDPDIVITGIDYVDDIEVLVKAIELANNGMHVYVGLLETSFDYLPVFFSQLGNKRPKKLKSLINKLQMMMILSNTNIKDDKGYPFFVQEMLPYTQEQKEKLLALASQFIQENYYEFASQITDVMKESMEKEGFNLDMSLARHTAHDNLSVEQAKEFLASPKRFKSFTRS